MYVCDISMYTFLCNGQYEQLRLKTYCKLGMVTYTFYSNTCKAQECLPYKKSSRPVRATQWDQAKQNTSVLAAFKQLQ